MANYNVDIAVALKGAEKLGRFNKQIRDVAENIHKYLKDCFHSLENVEKRKKAEELSYKYNCSSNDIALSWVIDQKFPSYAIIGPKNKSELRFSMNSINILLSDEDKKWLNLT